MVLADRLFLLHLKKPKNLSIKDTVNSSKIHLISAVRGNKREEYETENRNMYIFIFLKEIVELLIKFIFRIITPELVDRGC